MDARPCPSVKQKACLGVYMHLILLLLFEVHQISGVDCRQRQLFCDILFFAVLHLLSTEDCGSHGGGTIFKVAVDYVSTSTFPNICFPSFW